MAQEIAIRGEQRGWLPALRDRIERVFNRWLSRHGSRADAPTRADAIWPSLFGPAGFGPAVDVINEDDQVRVVAELPGLSKDDFTVKAEARRVYLEGERKSEREERRHGYTYAERSYGSFSRVVPLPCEVLPDKAQASYRDGLLELRLPKSDAARARNIRVEIS